MKLGTFKNPRFIKTATKPEEYPKLVNLKGAPLPEIAVVGRSNVGKSSLLNDLFHTKKLVRTSSTPGKTQTLNFFTVNEELAFADLPGYGYAKVPIAIRKAWGPMIENYLTKRKTLKLILFLFDIRRTPDEDDLQLLKWIVHNQIGMILVLTKVDKVNQSQKMQNSHKIIDAFNLENLHTLYYSVPKGIGRTQLIHMVCDALSEVEGTS